MGFLEVAVDRCAVMTSTTALEIVGMLAGGSGLLCIHDISYRPVASIINFGFMFHLHFTNWWCACRQLWTALHS